MAFAGGKLIAKSREGKGHGKANSNDEYHRDGRLSKKKRVTERRVGPRDKSLPGYVKGEVCPKRIAEGPGER